MATQSLGSLVTYLRLDNRSLNKSIAASQVRIAKFAKVASIGLTAVAGVFAFKLTKSFVDFDKEMTKSLAIMGNISTEVRNSLGKTAQDLSTQVGFTAAEIAKGYFFLFSAGKNLVQSQQLIGDVARFAQAGQFDLATATSLLTDVQNALGLSSKNVVKDQKEMIRVSDVLVKANTLADATTQQFAESLTTDSAAMMRAFKVPMEEGVAVLAAFADRGIKGEKAGANFGRVLRLLLPAAIKNKRVFEQMNISVFDSKGELNNMADIVGDLTRALKGMSSRQKVVALDMLGFKKRVQHAILPLVGAGKAISTYESKLRKAGSTTKTVAGNQLLSFANQMGQTGKNILHTAGELVGMDKILQDSAMSLKKLNAQWKDSNMGWLVTLREMGSSTKNFVVDMNSLFEALFVDHIGTLLGNATANLQNFFEWLPRNAKKLKDNLSSILGGVGQSIGNLLNAPFVATGRLVTALIDDTYSLGDAMKDISTNVDDIILPIAKALNDAKTTDFETVGLSLGVDDLHIYDRFENKLIKSEEKRAKKRLEGWLPIKKILETPIRTDFKTPLSKPIGRISSFSEDTGITDTFKVGGEGNLESKEIKIGLTKLEQETKDLKDFAKAQLKAADTSNELLRSIYFKPSGIAQGTL